MKSLPTPRLSPSLLTLLGVGLLLPLPLSAFDITARADYRWTENLGLASGATDYRDAATSAAELNAAHVRQLAPNLLLRAHLEGSLSVSPDYSSLTAAEAGPRLVLQRKFGLGPTAPMLKAEARTFGRLARLDECTGLGAQAATTLSKRFHALIAVAVRGELEQRWSRGDVYDTHHHAVSAPLTLDPQPRVRLVAGAGHLRGLIVAGAFGARFAGALAGALGPVIEA